MPTRRGFLRAAGLGLGGLGLADLMRLRAASGTTGRRKSVIMIWLRGGASHIDSHDPKPDAPAEIRGEFGTIPTTLPGVRLCEYMPLQARMTDKLAIVRGIKSNDLGDHTPHYILTGFADRGVRPSFGSVVSHQLPPNGAMPPYVSLMYKAKGDHESPTYLGPAHRPFVPRGEGLDDLRPNKQVSAARLGERRDLLAGLDTLRRDLDQSGQMGALDTFSRRALEVAAAPGVREAFDLSREPESVRERYGKFCENFLLARRLAEAGVPAITLKVGDWDTHEKNFIDMREQLPPLDRGFSALVSDLHDRGLDKDVAVVMWGEFGRSPNISRGDGRDHWPEAGAAGHCGRRLPASGQVIGETDKHGGRSKGVPYTPTNVLANLYRHLGVDTEALIPDRMGRPMRVLDDAVPVKEL